MHTCADSFRLTGPRVCKVENTFDFGWSLAGIQHGSQIPILFPWIVRMMNWFKMIATYLVLTAATVVAVAQPEIQEAPAGTDEGTMGAFGNGKPFSLMVDQADGEMEFNYNDETKELESITAKKGVILSSEEMTLNADQLDYDTVSSKLIATGQRVVVRQGDVIATCQKFLYNPTTQASELHGGPVVYNKSKSGDVTKVRGGVIQIYQQNGKPKWKVVKGASLEQGGNAPGAPAAAMPGAPAATGGGLNFNLGGGSGQPAPAAPVSNRIDPSNPADVQSLSGRTRDVSR